MIKNGDRYLQELRDAADARDRKREFLMILSLPRLEVDAVSLYVLRKEERN